MENDIYKQHAAAFSRVEAYAITLNGERVASVAFKRSASNLRTTCFLHVFGSRMVKGSANGGGYDKASAAFHAAAERLDLKEGGDSTLLHAFKVAGHKGNGGLSWDSALRDAGFAVFQAV